MDAEAQKKIVVDALEDLKAVNIVTLDVTGLTDVMDFLIIASGTYNRHVKSLADNVCMEAKRQELRPLGVEGEDAGEWVLVDFGDVVVHVMLPEERDRYRLDRLWGAAGLTEYSDTGEARRVRETLPPDEARQSGGGDA